MLKRLATLAALMAVAIFGMLTPNAAFAGGSPAGNNGTVKIAEDGDIDTPSNDPHVGCTFTVEWYGYDKGSSIISNVSFEMQAPTASVGLTVTGDPTVFVGGDDNTGGGSAAGLDGREQYTLGFKGAAHPQQGYHVKMTVNTPGSNGADKKSKVFWVTGCAETVTPAPRMSMTKTVTDSNDADSLASQGETLTYSFSVTNTGNVPLTNVKITDAMIPALTNGAVCVATLAVGATTTCPSLPTATHVTTAAEVSAGKVTNNATAAGTPPSGANITAPGTASINTYAPPAAAPAMTMTKTVRDSDDADTLASQGETLTYGFSVTNTGNVALSNVTVTDTMIPALAHGALCVGTLAVGATTTCPSLPAATHATTAAEVSAGKVVNTATSTATAASGTNPTAQAGATINTYAPPVGPDPAPSISVHKSVADSADADTLASQGETLTYGFSVTNTGNVPLTNVKITDAMIPALVNGATCVGTLAPGATTTCPTLPAATHVVTSAEVSSGRVVNTATGTGTAPSGARVDAQGSATIGTYAPPPEPTPAPAISLTKTVADSDDADSLGSEGETLTYTFSVTNTGNVALSNVTITDAMIPALTHGATCVASLAAGATTTCPSLPAATHVVSSADVAHGSVDNTATAVGTSPAGTNVSDQDSATIDTVDPVVVPDPDEPFSWDWTYADPTCSALTVEYPWNIPDGQANDVNVRVLTNQGEVTLNFHNNEGFWSGNTEFAFSSHPRWPAGVTSYAVVWTQVGGTNYHWQGNVRCLVNDDGDPTTVDEPVAVTTIAGWRNNTVVVRQGESVSADMVSVSQADDQDLVLQVLSAGSARGLATWHDVKTVATNGTDAKVTFGRQLRTGTFKYRLAVAGSDTVTGATTKTFTIKVR